MPICAIHQPNFFPWLGYFDKIRRADIFVFLDDVAYPRSGSGMGSWINRVKIDIQGSAAWLGCPLQRMPGRFLIREARIDDRQPWRKRALRTIEMNYKRTPRFSVAFPLIQGIIQSDEDRLSEFNITAVKRLSSALGVSTRFVRQSELQVQGTATELLINIAKAVEADTYLCGSGASGYQEDDLFRAEGIELRYQGFKPVPYGAPDRWLPGMSVIDYLMNADPLEHPW